VTQQKKAKNSGSKNKTKNKSDSASVGNIEIFGKKILLPATTAAIQLWLKSLGDH
jgi:hypothetical protein